MFTVRGDFWTGLFDADLLLSEFLDEAAHELDEDDFLLPDNFLQQLVTNDAYGFCSLLNKWAKSIYNRWEFVCVNAPGLLYLNNSETATVLAALRLYQATSESSKEAKQVLDIATNDGQHKALSDEEIEVLINKINYA